MKNQIQQKPLFLYLGKFDWAFGLKLILIPASIFFISYFAVFNEYNLKGLRFVSIASNYYPIGAILMLVTAYVLITYIFSIDLRKEGKRVPENGLLLLTIAIVLLACSATLISMSFAINYAYGMTP